MAQEMFVVFAIMRDLHELLWYLNAALALPAAHTLFDELRQALTTLENLTHGHAQALKALDVSAQRQSVNLLLLRASELVRAEVQQKKKEYRGMDLVRANFKGADLRGANLRGACLIGANLRDADLQLADLLGADLRDADLRGAKLRQGLFLLQSQLDSARGNHTTTLPSSLMYPIHWQTPKRV